MRKTSDVSVALELGQPTVELGGQFVGITQTVLNIAGVNLNEEARKALEKAIDPNTLAFSIPPDYKALNPKIQAAAFEDRGGKLFAKVDLSAAVPAENLTEFLRGIIQPLASPPAAPQTP